MSILKRHGDYICPIYSEVNRGVLVKGNISARISSLRSLIFDSSSTHAGKESSVIILSVHESAGNAKPAFTDSLRLGLPVSHFQGELITGGFEAGNIEGKKIVAIAGSKFMLERTF